MSLAMMVVSNGAAMIHMMDEPLTSCIASIAVSRIRLLVQYS